MIIEKKIGEVIYLEQRTYYIYRNEEDRKNGRAFLTTSDKKTFDMYKKLKLKDLSFCLRCGEKPEKCKCEN